ncbi:LytR/AlgR family response regulator transcription factor [Marinobacter sp. C2H3]|uniref:LytR/AlgR family response regulator transcription factor n=1 Tax=Marinobacter sp. C2H3 TaxID=3119003 RepID=UPI00300F4F3D
MTQPVRSELTVLIADDEPLARERLRRLLGELSGYRVCGEAADGDQTLQQVAEQAPDILLLDIRMPGLDGLEAAQRLSRLPQPPAILFCTAYDHYALQAFGVQAAGYLLKPVRREALADALARIGRVNRVQQQALATAATPAPADQLAVRTHRGTELIPLAELRYCEADQKYVTLYHTAGETVCDFTLKELEAAYPDHLLRIHRNTLVGVRFLRALERTREGQHQVRLTHDGTPLPVSRRHAADVRQWLQTHRPG